MTEAIVAKVSTSWGQRLIELCHHCFTFSRVRVTAASASTLALTMAIQKEVGRLPAIGAFRFL